MNAWNILELEPTTDLKAIKKAYARQLKKIDQDTQATLFIQLREAFATAQFQAENMRHIQDDDLFENTDIDSNPQHDFLNTHSIHIDSEMDIKNNNVKENSKQEIETFTFQPPILGQDLNVPTSDQTEITHQSNDYSLELNHHSDQVQSPSSWLITELNECFDQLEQAIAQQLANFPLQEKIEYFFKLMGQLEHEDIQKKYSEQLDQLFKENALEDFLSTISQENHFSQNV